MIGLYISCTGKVIICQMDIPTKFEELNEQIISVFNSLGDWKPGILNGKEVDRQYN